MPKKVSLFLAVLFAGIIAGGQYVVLFDYHPAGMSDVFYTMKMQRAINVIGTPLFSVQILAGVFSILSAILFRGKSNFYFVLAAALLCIIGPLLTYLGAIPRLDEIATWNANSPPSNWHATAIAWWNVHAVRLGIQLTAFFLLLLAVFGLRADSELKQ